MSVANAAQHWDAAHHPPDHHHRFVQLTGRDDGAYRRRMVLLVCTDLEAENVTRAWSGNALDVRACGTLATALLLIGRSDPDVVVIGAVHGPIGTIDFLRALRAEDTETPVILGLDETQGGMGVDALTAGATAIMRRPFSADDLLRILSFTASAGDPIPVRPLPIDVGGRLRVDGASPRMWFDGTETLLPRMEHLLLWYLARRPGELLSRTEIIEAVWGDLGSRSSNTLTVHLGRLRRRLEGNDGEDWIRPVRGFGYQFLIPEVQGQCGSTNRRLTEPTPPRE